MLTELFCTLNVLLRACDSFYMSKSSISLLLARLQSDSLFKKITDSDLARLLGTIEEVQFGADELIYHRGEPAHSLYLFSSGQAVITDESSKTASMANLRCGEESAGGLSHYQCTATAQSPMQGWRIPKSSLSTLVTTYPDLRANALLALSRYHGDTPINIVSKRGFGSIAPFTAFELLGWFCALLLPIAIFLLGERFNLSNQASIFSAILGCMVMLWVFSLVDEFVPPLIAVVA